MEQMNIRAQLRNSFAHPQGFPKSLHPSVEQFRWVRSLLKNWQHLISAEHHWHRLPRPPRRQGLCTWMKRMKAAAGPIVDKEEKRGHLTRHRSFLGIFQRDPAVKKPSGGQDCLAIIVWSCTRAEFFRGCELEWCGWSAWNNTGGHWLKFWPVAEVLVNFIPGRNFIPFHVSILFSFPVCLRHVKKESWTASLL